MATLTMHTNFDNSSVWHIESYFFDLRKSNFASSRLFFRQTIIILFHFALCMIQFYVVLPSSYL